MKKAIAIGIVFIFTVVKSEAQDKVLRTGSRITLGQSEVTGDAFPGKRAGLLMGVGGSADYNFTSYFGLMGDAMFQSKSFKMQGVETSGLLNEKQEYTDKFHFYQAELPFMGKISIGGEKFRLRAFAGPVFTFNIVGVQSRQYKDAQTNEEKGFYNRNMQEVNIFEQGLVYGLGMEIKSRGTLFFADLRSGRNLSPSATYAGNNVYFQYFNISLGVLY